MEEPPISKEPPELWAELRHRQERLPLRRLHRRSDWYAISHNEQRAVRRLANRYDLSETQGFSLLNRHLDEVRRRAAAAAPDVVRSPRSRDSAVSGYGLVATRRRVMPRGWAVWFSNRQVSVLAYWLRVTARLG
jgi:hypothetical protein